MKRNPIEIVEELFDALEKTKACSINELASRTGIHNLTIRRYIKLIETVRREPELEVIRTRHSIILRLRR